MERGTQPGWIRRVCRSGKGGEKEEKVEIKVDGTRAWEHRLQRSPFTCPHSTHHRPSSTARVRTSSLLSYLDTLSQLQSIQLGQFIAPEKRREKYSLKPRASLNLVFHLILSLSATHIYFGLVVTDGEEASGGRRDDDDDDARVPVPSRLRRDMAAAPLQRLRLRPPAPLLLPAARDGTGSSSAPPAPAAAAAAAAAAGASAVQAPEAHLQEETPTHAAAARRQAAPAVVELCRLRGAPLLQAPLPQVQSRRSDRRRGLVVLLPYCQNRVRAVRATVFCR